jgi:hypothetical protein
LSRWNAFIPNLISTYITVIPTKAGMTVMWTVFLDESQHLAMTRTHKLHTFLTHTIAVHAKRLRCHLIVAF